MCNASVSGQARLALGPIRDLVAIDAIALVVPRPPADPRSVRTPPGPAQSRSSLASSKGTVMSCCTARRSFCTMIVVGQEQNSGLNQLTRRLDLTGFRYCASGRLGRVSEGDYDQLLTCNSRPEGERAVNIAWAWHCEMEEGGLNYTNLEAVSAQVSGGMILSALMVRMTRTWSRPPNQG
jgi:hypothetical protein